MWAASISGVVPTNQPARESECRACTVGINFAASKNATSLVCCSTLPAIASRVAYLTMHAWVARGAESGGVAGASHSTTATVVASCSAEATRSACPLRGPLRGPLRRRGPE
jgi:hypothetical protein